MATLKLIKQPFTFTFSRNPVLFRFRITPFEQEEIDLNTRVNVSLECESEYMTFDLSERKAVSLRPDANGFCEIDFQSVLNAQLEFYVPQPKGLHAQVCRKQSLFYRIKYYLSNDYEAVVEAQYTSFSIIIKGGLSKPQMDIKTYFENCTPYGGVKKFMRYDYEDERLNAMHPLWLYCLLPALNNAVTSVKLSVFTEVEGGAVELYEKDTTLRAWSGGILCVPAGIGPYQFNLPYHKEAIVIRYELRDNNFTLLAGTDDIFLDHRNHYNSRHLFFHNSIGGFDALMLTGVIQSKGSYEKEKSFKIKAREYDPTGRLSPEEEQRNSREHYKQIGQTGYLPLDRIEMLRDIFNSNNAYEFLSVPGSLSLNKLIPVNVNVEDTDLHSTDEQLHNLQIEWESAFADENFTPDNSVPIATICPTVDFFSIDQVIGQTVFAEWQLTDTYERIEIRMSDNPAHTAADATDIFFYDKNQGSANIEVTYAFSAPLLTVTVYLWARTICDVNAPESSYSAGPWTARQSLLIYRFAAPVVRSDFANTYKGAGSRSLVFKDNANSVFANDTKHEAVGALRITTSSATGSAGGTLTLNPTDGTATYTPANANYTGVEVFSYTLVEEVLLPAPFGLTASKPASGKIYVTVQDFISGGVTGTGKPFVRILLADFGSYESAGPSYHSWAILYFQFFADAAGTVPMDVTGMGITVTCNWQEVKNNGTPVSQAPLSALGVGTQTQVRQVPIMSSYIDTYTYTYSLAPSSDYFII